MSGVEVFTILSVAGTLVSTVGAIQQGQAAQAEADFNAKIAERNAKIAEQQATAAHNQAVYEEARLRDKALRLRGTQRAAIAASGVQLEGSPLLAITDSAAEAELDALAIRYSGSIDEARARSQAGLDRLDAQATRLAGRNQARAAYTKAGSSLLTGTTRLADRLGK